MNFWGKPDDGMTVDGLIDALTAWGDQPVVILSTRGELVPGDLGSYRGYYEDLAIEAAEPAGKHAKPLMAREFSADLEAMLWTTITGYKGGNYQVTRDTLVWVSEYGECSGEYPQSVRSRDGRCEIVCGSTR